MKKKAEDDDPEFQKAMDLVRQTYDSALKINEVKMNPGVWISYAEFEQKHEAFTRARTILQNAR